MLVKLIPMHDDGTRDTSLQPVIVDPSQVQATFPAAADYEQEARRLEVFREAHRLFEADPKVWQRMQRLMRPPHEATRYVPKPQTRRELYPILIELHDTLFPPDRMPTVAAIVVAPDDRTISFWNGVDWTIWHLRPQRPDTRVYNNGQPFGDPLIEIWRDEDWEPWDGEEETSERP